MKNRELFLKIAACVLAGAAAACLVLANLERLMACLDCLCETLREKKATLCKGCCSAECYDDEEFEDWDV